jgi:hypothetical protein
MDCNSVKSLKLLYLYLCSVYLLATVIFTVNLSIASHKRPLADGVVIYDEQSKNSWGIEAWRSIACDGQYLRERWVLEVPSALLGQEMLS